MLFTENGIAMLSSVLNSEEAIQVNIAIMRVFTKLKSFQVMDQNLKDRLDKLEDATTKTFRIVFERMDEIEAIITPNLPSKRKKIGF